MTSQKDQIQRLIAEIDATLAKPASRLPLGLSGEAERQRQLLGKLFSYLQTLSQTFDSPGGWGPIDPGTGEFVGASPSASSNLADSNLEASASQVLQGLLQEMSYLRENSLKPMRQELEVLQQRRDSLQAEVSVLEAQRSPDPFQSEQQINAFLETLMQRLQEQLSAQMVQNLADMEAATLDRLSTTDNPAPLLTGQRLEQVRLLQAESDQLLLKLDSTLTAVFNSLQKSVDSYRESLEEGLDQMHGLGRQGEVIFHAFVNHLAQQLGQDASSYLTGEVGEAVQRAALQDPEVTADVDLGAVQLDDLDQALDDLALDADAGEGEESPGVEIAPDLALLDDDVPLDGLDFDEDEDITVIQGGGMPDVEAELALLEDAIASDVDSDDEDITVIQTADGLNLVVDLEEEITAIQGDDMPDVESELAQLEAAISNDVDDGLTLDELGLADDSSDDGDPSDDGGSSDDGTAPLGEGEESLGLDLSLGDLDESLGLLAVGADSGDLLGLTDGGDDSQDMLPQLESEGELFNFDANVDQELDASPVVEDSVDRFEAALFPDEVSGSEVSGSIGVNDLDESSRDLLALGLTDADAIETPSPSLDADDGQVSEADLLDAEQVADSWLFDLGPVDDGMSGHAGEDATTLDELMTPSPSSVSEQVIDDETVETLFGDSTAPAEPDLGGADGEDTVESLSELLPDGQSADGDEENFADNVPDDVYIAASADEDLINLVETRSDQRLLIDFDDGPLVEQLDEDLQKLAGDTFSADYGVDEDDALEPLDQSTLDNLENIASDLNLEDVNLTDEPGLDLVGAESIGFPAMFPGEDAVAPAVPEVALPTNEDADAFDLFEGYATDSVDVDDPSGNDLDLAAIASPSVTDAGSQELDLVGLITEPLEDEFEDGLPDSLADELSELSAESNALSQEPGEAVIDQFVSDLEAPVMDEDETLSIPAIDETAPDLDSASMPDLPPDGLNDGLEAGLEIDAPVSDDFLQAEQAAFLQTLTEDDAVAPLESPAASSETPAFETPAFETPELETPEPDAFSFESADLGLSDGEGEVDDGSGDLSYEMSLEAVSEDLADDFDDLLMPSDDVSSSRAEADGKALDLGDLDELFGQSSPSDLAALEQDQLLQPDVDQSLDSLADLDLGTATPPEVLVPLIPDAPVSGDGVVLPTFDALADPESRAVDAGAVGDLDTGLNTPVAVPPVTVPETPAVNLDGDWFLGVDVGATGLSAVLMNRRTGQVYPLYWHKTASDTTKQFRLPATAVLTPAQDTVAVGYDALGDLGDLVDVTCSAAELVGVNRIKPLLKVAVGHGQTLSMSDPWVRWSDTVELPMLQMLQAMVALLKKVANGSQAVGLEGDNLSQVFARLQGVIMGYPTNWPDTYSFNLREAVLEAGLIDQPGQVVFVEDAIATVLSGLPDPRDSAVAETVSLSRQPSLYNCQWQEGTVIISGGAVMTELGLINLPKDLASLNYGDFALRGFAYAGDALDQDIVCQLLLPQDRRQAMSAGDATTTRWDWQGHLAAEDADWSQLNLDGLTLPNVGHVDWAQRYGLQHRLLGSNLGQSLLAAARHLKLTLQQQNQVQITLAGQCWLIKRRHLENLIFLPYIQRINRYLNVLLSHHGMDAQSIKQVLCTGGSASLPAIARWLRQKFPNATIIQDTYASELPQSCSRVAYGLVNLARYPQVLNVTRQQYSDYFLLMELLRVFPQQPLPVGAILHLLEQRGINTQACHLHILALLEGHLPPGLVPTAADRGLICDRTTDLSTYRALLQTPLFNKTVTESGGHMYIPNEAQAVQLRAYLNRLLLNKVQTLEEPLIAQLEVLA